MKILHPADPLRTACVIARVLTRGGAVFALVVVGFSFVHPATQGERLAFAGVLLAASFACFILHRLLLQAVDARERERQLRPRQ